MILTTRRPLSEGAHGQPAGEGGPAARVIFAGGNEFQTALRRRIDSYFQESGHRRRDSLQMYFKAAAILATFVTLYAVLVFVPQGVWTAVPLAVLLGLTTAGIGFNIQHDGGHEAFSRFQFVNRLMSRSLDLIGASSYLWSWEHRVFHHSYPNLNGHDSDIALGGLARLTPHQPHHAYHRWQHWYRWGLYGGTAFRWHFYSDFYDLLAGRIGEHRIPWPKRRELLILIGGKATFFTLAFGIPLFFHPWWVVALYYVLVTLVLGVVLSVVFQLAHCVEEADFPKPAPDSGRLETPWAVHQVQTTVDFCQNGRVMTWLLGGLNYQIEHHLFPRIAHSHYPAIAPLVRDTCREFGVRYREHRSFWAGIVSHHRWLRRMGTPGTVE